MIDTNVDLQSKELPNYNLSEAPITGNEFINHLFEEVFFDFVSSINKIKNNDTNIDLVQTYKSLGKLELINGLVSDILYKKVLESGKIILNDYVKNNG